MPHTIFTTFKKLHPAYLSQEAKKKLYELKNVIGPFSGEIYGCPFYKYWHTNYYTNIKRGNSPRFEGILFLQDWNKYELLDTENNIECATEYVQQFFKTEPAKNDRTITPLLNSGWKKYLENGSWLVTNAVWGLRKSEKKSGYLGNSVHARAAYFWWDLINLLSEDFGYGFNLAFAGSWSHFDNYNRGDKIDIAIIYNLWSEWAQSHADFHPKMNFPIFNKYIFEGKVAFCIDHPSYWKNTIGQDGPP